MQSAVGMSLRLLRSTRLTLAGFALLGAAVAVGQWQPQRVYWAVVFSLALLALNLTAALVFSRELRRGGLGVFHLSLLGCLLLVAWGRLTHLDARIEIVDGQPFSPDAVQVVARGPMHSDSYRDLHFTQGPFTVDYAPGLRRQHTISKVAVGHAVGRQGQAPAQWQQVGDDHPLVLEGYRFYTTHNKGFAPILSWIAPGAAALTGAVHMPDYPGSDWKQEQTWTPPAGPEMRFWLRQAKPVTQDEAWTLEPRKTDAVLVVEFDGRRFELRPGQEAVADRGVLRYEYLAGWMGYRIFYDPTLMPLLWLSVLGVVGMAVHLWSCVVAPRRRDVDARCAGRSGLA